MAPMQTTFATLYLGNNTAALLRCRQQGSVTGISRTPPCVAVFLDSLEAKQVALYFGCMQASV